ncbi:MAG TPA: oxygenase MpaB family protein [Aeromicrobium sp.]|nr:oxygenase MpaB family protein [Aeromicrobium sp.]
MPTLDEGYFPPGSMLRFVQSHRAVGHTYGQRALIIGATHPVPYTGTSAHSDAKSRPFERLARTAKAFETIYFGTRREADRVLNAVGHMHQRVNGSLPQREGTFAAGTTYDAFDPDLMLWTLAMLADSSRVAFETLVRRLSRDEAEELWLDWLRFGELFGMPRSAAPADAQGLSDFMADWYRGGRMHLTDEAKVVGRAIATDMPVPPLMSPGIRATNLVVCGMLPQPVRDLYRLRWTPAHEVAFQVACVTVRQSRPVVPRAIRRGDNARLHDLVIATERRRISAGHATMQLPA